MFFKIITIGNPGKKDPLEKDTLMLAIYKAFREAFSDLPAYAPPERKQGELMRFPSQELNFPGLRESFRVSAYRILNLVDEKILNQSTNGEISDPIAFYIHLALHEVLCRTLHDPQDSLKVFEKFRDFHERCIMLEGFMPALEKARSNTQVLTAFYHCILNTLKGMHDCKQHNETMLAALKEVNRLIQLHTDCMESAVVIAQLVEMGKIKQKISFFGLGFGHEISTWSIGYNPFQQYKHATTDTAMMISSAQNLKIKWMMLMGLKDRAEKLARKDLFCYSLAPVYEATLKVYQALEEQSRPFRELSSSVLKAQVNATQHDAHYAMLLPPLSPQAHYPDAREFFNRYVVAPGKRHFSDADLIPIVTELEKMLPSPAASASTTPFAAAAASGAGAAAGQRASQDRTPVIN